MPVCLKPRATCTSPIRGGHSLYLCRYNTTITESVAYAHLHGRFFLRRTIFKIVSLKTSVRQASRRAACVWCDILLFFLVKRPCVSSLLASTMNQRCLHFQARGRIHAFLPRLFLSLPSSQSSSVFPFNLASIPSLNLASMLPLRRPLSFTMPPSSPSPPSPLSPPHPQPITCNSEPRPQTWQILSSLLYP